MIKLTKKMMQAAKAMTTERRALMDELLNEARATRPGMTAEETVRWMPVSYQPDVAAILTLGL